MPTIDAIVNSMRYQLEGLGPSPLYTRLMSVAIDDTEQGGMCAEVFAHTPDGVEPVLDALPLRFLGAIHSLVLAGDAPDLACYYPSVGGAFDAGDDHAKISDAFLSTIADRRAEVIAGLGRAVQTNEVGRCASLLPGFLMVAAVTGLPLRILEVGTSAGLNLRWDHYRYEGGAGGTAWGDASSPLCFDDVFDDPRPAIDVDARVAERRGCDRNPIDAGTPEGSTLLRSFVWPDQRARFQALDAALTVAASVPVAVDRADAPDWIDEQLRAAHDGVATVLFHSIVWQYLPPETRAAIKDMIAAAGGRATPSAPFAWLSMEPGAEPAKGADIRLTLWPGGEQQLLARTGYHGAPVRLIVDGD